MNPSQQSHNNQNITSDNISVSSHFHNQNQTHSLSQRHLTQTQVRPGLSQTQQPSYMPSNLQSQNISEQGSVNQEAYIANFTIEEIKEKFRNFLMTFEAPVEGGMEQEVDGMQEEAQIQKVYMEKMNFMKDTGNFFLMIDADHMYQADRDLYRKLVGFPSEIIPIMDVVAVEVYIDMRKQNMEENFETEMDIMQDSQNILVGIFNMRKQKRVRDLQPTDINRLVSVKGIVIRCSNIFPEMKKATFECTRCQNVQQSNLSQGRVEEPQTCPSCKQKFTYEIKHNACYYTDKQYIKIQETPDSIPEGETPQSTTLVAYDQNVDNIRPGDRIESVGILRAQGIRQNTQRRTLKSVYGTFIDVISFSRQDSKRFVTNVGEDQEEQQEKVTFTEEQKRNFYEIAENPRLYDILVKSLAPSIWENQDVKKGILSQLFGGTQKDFQQTGKGRFRAEINCLLVGDPSVAKSQLLQYVHKIAPRGIYTSGKGSSAVGLTAYVTRDPDTKDIILESGALVLSDLGICCIDEFDKMDESTRTILLEAMEQQTISIAKSGIVAQLNARTAVLAGANPINSKYDPKQSVVQNINLSPPLLSRFDLIYIMLDTPQQVNDEVLCQHLMNLYSRPEDQQVPRKKNQMMEEEEDETEELQVLNKNLFAQYISYARTSIKPTLTDEAVKALQEEYCALRQQGQSRNVIVCTTRQLESAIRLSEAQAKMRLRTEVLKEDVDEAFRLIKVATQSAATDPVTGMIDMDVIQTGVSAHSKQKLKTLSENILKVFQNEMQSYRNGVKFADFYKQLEEVYKNEPEGQKPKMDEIQAVLVEYIKSNTIMQFGHEKVLKGWTIKYVE